MQIWIVQLGEPLPIDGHVRLYRCGILAEMLAKRGHAVTWWTSTFNHTRKIQRYIGDHSVVVERNYRIELLYSEGYQKNASLARLRFHRSIARRFASRISETDPPDIILAGFPTPGLVKAAVDFGVTNQVPVVVDIRDLWPDVFLDLLPSWGWLRKLTRLALQWAFRENHYIFGHASSLTSISEDYLRWGLVYAGRQPSYFDKVFYMGYPQSRCDPVDVQNAMNQWILRGINSEAFVCCFFGTINRHFDLTTVIKAANVLEADCKGIFQFVLCGEGSHLDHYKYISQGVGNVFFPGWVGAVEIEALMALSKIGLAPYAANAKMSLPNKPFEYFSAGLPVLSSLQGELELILRQYACGTTYQSDDVDRFVKILRELWGDPTKLRTMGNNGRQLFLKRFSADRAYSAMIDHLERIALSQST